MIKLTKDMKFDMFYNGTKYMDHKNLSLNDLYNEVGNLLECFKPNTKNIELGWINPTKSLKNTNRVNFYNLVKLANESLGYIVCLPGEIYREPFRKQELKGESSILKEIYESNYINKQNKEKQKFHNSLDGQMFVLRIFSRKIWQQTKDYYKYKRYSFSYEQTHDKQYYCEDFDTWFDKNKSICYDLYKVKYNKQLIEVEKTLNETSKI